MIKNFNKYNNNYTGNHLDQFAGGPPRATVIDLENNKTVKN